MLNSDVSSCYKKGSQDLHHILARLFYYMPHYPAYLQRRSTATFIRLILHVGLLGSLGVAFTTNYRLVKYTDGAVEEVNDLDTLSPILRYEVFFYISGATFMLTNSTI